MSARSPFARRIRLAMQRLKLPVVERAVDVFAPISELTSLNPLGMIPTLVTPDGVLSDSANILEYLHETTGAIWPGEFRARTEIRQASVWCEGIMQSSVLYFQECRLHEVPSPRWLADHQSSILDTFDQLSKLNESIWIQNNNLTQAAWDLGVALQYCDLRLPEFNWRVQYSGFSKILDFANQDSWFRESVPKL